MPGLLEIDNIHKSFGGLHVLRGVSFELAENEVTCLIGPNGAGKTTAFNVVTGFLRADSGSIRLRGEDVTRLGPERLMGRGVARSFQLLRLFDRMTVLENVQLAVQGQAGEHPLLAMVPLPSVLHSESKTTKRAREALAEVGLVGRENVWVSGLAYAEQKLVAIAQLIAADASIVLLDEPTSGLDGQSLEDAIATVRRMKEQGKTALVVEHNVSVVRELADRVLFLDQGIVYAQGTPDEVIGDPHLAEVYFGVTKEG